MNCKLQRPVSAETGISYNDFSSMHTYDHKQSPERRLPTPLWAVSDPLLREVLVAFLEARAGIRKPEGTLLERRERARLAVIAQRPRLTAKLDEMNHKYVQLQQAGVKRAYLKRMEIQIENLDSLLRCNMAGDSGGLATLAAVVYLYYRVGLNSVEVAQRTGLKPPHVRQLLYRMNNIWTSLHPEESTSKPHPKRLRCKRRSAYQRSSRGLLRADRTVKGLCTECGRPADPFVMCEICRKYFRDWMAKRRKAA